MSDRDNKVIARNEGLLDQWIGLYIYRRDNNAVLLASNFEFVEVSPHVVHELSLFIDRTNAQELMDSLWSCGIRPTEGAGSAGALSAVKYHLEDMRKLVFHQQTGAN